MPFDSADTTTSPHLSQIALAQGNLVKPAFASYLMSSLILLSLIGGLTVLMGEGWIRLPTAPKGLQYLYDAELGYRLAPHQIASSRLLGLYGIESPLIHIDGRGFRNRSADWNGLTLLALGSSEVMGPGVAEEDIWTFRLGDMLSQHLGARTTIYNAATGGYGPYHSAVVLRRLLKDGLIPGLIIVRVSPADASFVQPPPDQLIAEKGKKELNEKLKRYLHFAPLLSAKIRLQAESLQSFKSNFFHGRNVLDGYSSSAAATMWSQNERHWSTIVMLASQHHIPLLFLVADPYDTPGPALLFQNMRLAFGNRQCVFVQRLSSQAFGIAGMELKERRGVFKERYMLSHDEHANALQHRIIASELFQYLDDLHLVERLRITVSDGCSCC